MSAMSKNILIGFKYYKFCFFFGERSKGSDFFFTLPICKRMEEKNLSESGRGRQHESWFLSVTGKAYAGFNMHQLKQFLNSSDSCLQALQQGKQYQSHHSCPCTVSTTNVFIILQEGKQLHFLECAVTSHL